MRKVAIVYRTIPQYRRRFYEMMRERLAELDIEFLLLYGQPGHKDALKMDSIEIPWAIKIPNRIWEFGGRELYWQPVLGRLKDVDLVIVEQASKLLINYVLLLQNMLGLRKMAFWGHGKNLQETSASLLAERIKKLVSTRVHWWFAYNDLSAGIVRQLGYPPERITSVQNAIDTRYLTKIFQTLTEEDIDMIRQELGIQSEHVCIYASGMYPEKRLGFLLDSLFLVRQQIVDFEMIFIGSGTDAGIIQQAATENAWIHYIGPKFDDKKVPFFAVSKLFLMPGLVGLGVLDAFALETPLVTTRVPLHSPEIDYLQDGINGVMVEDAYNPQSYAQAVVHFLRDETDRQTLVKGCRSARAIYTVEAMVERFSEGILKALS
jgi:glycosyltransferase involved in cell wall biosynthesis